MKNNIKIALFTLITSIAALGMEAPPSKKTSTHLLSLNPNQFEREISNDLDLINQQDESGKTLLTAAIEQQKEVQAKLLINLGANPFRADIKRESALHAIAKTGNIKILRLLAKYHGDNPDWEAMLQEHNDALDKTLVCKTAVQSPLAWAQRLGYEPCSFIFKNIHKYKTLFSRALVLGEIETIKLILQAFPPLADVELTEKPACTPLSFAILLEDTELLKLLLATGAKKVGEFITQPMYTSMPTSLSSILEQHKIAAYFNQKQYPTRHDKQMGLSNAVLAYNPKSITKALNRGAKINGFDNKGNTALHWACTTGNPDLVAHMLSLGANPDLVDRDKKRTGLGWVLRMHKNSVEKKGKQVTTSELLPCFFLLMVAGANPNIRDIEGRNVITRLPAQGFNECEMELISRILKIKILTKEERKVLLKDINTYQTNEKDKWRKGDPKFDLRNVYDVENAKVKMTTKDGKVIFKEIYKGYIE